MAGEECVSCRMVVGVGDATVGVVDKSERVVGAIIAMEEGTLGIWSTEAEGKSSRPPEAVTGTEASRVEAGAEMLSGAAVLGARAEGTMEAGADTEETGGEVADRVGHGGEAIPLKDSRLWDPSLSTAAEKNTFSLC